MKSLNEKMLYDDEIKMIEYVRNIEHIFFSIMTNIFITLKDNIHIHHINNYENFTFDKNSYIEGDIPLIILLGGSAYKIYAKLFNEYFNNDIVSIKDYLIESIDYDMSILVNNTFDKNIAKNIIKKILINNTPLIEKINDIEELEIIAKEDIKNNEFLKTKDIIDKNFKKILITLSHNKSYTAIHFTIKYKGILFQIIELLFWYNGVISSTIHKNEFYINKCVLYQNKDFKILLPSVKTLIQSNITSMQSRLINNQYNKCTKDYYRLNFIKLISEIQLDYTKINNNDEKIFFENFINNGKLIYKKDNPYILKLPFNICSLEKTDEEKKALHKIYEKFINLNIYEQYNILSHGNFLSSDEIKVVKNIFNHHPN